MGIWIRSQDKEVIATVEEVYVEKVNGEYMINSIKVGLGKYDSKERALEVLDQIHNVVARNSSRDYLSGKYRVNQNYVFEMPKE